jgi:hypothetical protein
LACAVEAGVEDALKFLPRVPVREYTVPQHASFDLMLELPVFFDVF